MQHVEKLVLGVSVVLASLMIWWGMSSDESQSASKSPQDLQQKVQSARRNMDEPRWQTAYAPKLDTQLRLTGRAGEATTPVSLESYRTQVPWRPLYAPPRTRRTDPKLFPVRDLEFRPGRAAVAISGVAARARTSSMLTGESELLSSDNSRPLAPRDRDRYERAGGEGGGGQAAGIHFVSITGLIPFQEQLNEYKRCFENAVEYNVNRDFPYYFFFQVQRAEVNGNEEPTENDWKPLSRQEVARFEATWAGGQEEFTERDYVIANDDFVQAPGYRMPPILLQDGSKWASHSKIPIRDPDEEANYSEAEAATQEELHDPFATGTSGFRGGEPEGPSAFAQQGMEERSSSEELEKVTEYKLFRYFDTTVEPGKSYRYRVRLFLEDPNHPKNEMQMPTPRSLEPAVAARIQSESENLKPGIVKWYRNTDWSETSPVIQVPSAKSVLVGQATSAGRRPVGNTTFTNPLKEASVKVMALQFDKQKAADVPVEIELYRGSQANGIADTEYLRPTEFDLEKLTAYNIQSDAVVLDILGGERIRDLGETTPSEVLFLDSLGNLVIHNEMDDLPQYRWNTFEPEVRDEVSSEEPEGGEGNRFLEDDGEPGQGRANRRANSRNRRGGRGRDREFDPEKI